MTRPRLLVLINNFPPDRGGAAAVYGDMCQGLAERGFEVTVRCAYPYFPEWRDKTGRNGWKVWSYVEQGVRVERYGLYIPANPNSTLRRLLHELSFLLSLLRALPRSRSFDLVMAYCPAVSCLAYGVVNKLVFRQPLWLNVQDLAAEAATASGLVKHDWLGMLLRGVQGWFFNQAEVWSTISPVMAARLLPLRRREQPLLFLPNWLDRSLEQEFERIDAENGGAAARQRAIHAPVRLLYAGNISNKQNLLALLKVLQRSDARFEFAVHGSGTQAGEVERWISQARDPRFRFGPFLGARDYASVLSWTDFFVITETGDSGASFMPSKLVTGIAAGRPILAVCDADSPLGREVCEHDIGPRFGWTETAQVAALLKEMVGQPERFAAWSRKALIRAAQYDRHAIIDRLDPMLRSLASRRVPTSDY